MKAEEEKAKKDKKDEERRESERKDREAFRKQLTDSMNSRLDGVVELLRNKGSSNEVEAFRKEVEKLSGRNIPAVASTSSVHGMCQDTNGLLAKMLADQERMKSQLEEALLAKRRLELVEKEMNEVIRARDEAKADAEKWQQEALHPGKRGCITLTTPATKTTARASTSTPMKTLKSPVASVDLKKISDLHRLEVETIQEMRFREFKREAEHDLEKAKEKIAQLEREKSLKTPRSNLHARMDEAYTGKGKERCALDKSASTNEKEKETFTKDERKNLRGLTKDALVAICEKEGVKYTGVKQTVDDIVTHRLKKAFPMKDTVVEVSEDLGDSAHS
ncbi:hypothetical protein CBR_g26205 [Chara braunii]|uniref:Uncharacterized protein n=1 Tax=Chara braunii TaxID=69332 RepID=A0A388L7F3_CHABU|nr:hypothetical protein CBR_g26205 [Chara braunii]|eukprot:GBG78172.1 hypothetical protein CBR_g26205 [Chara braunii]